MKRLLHIFCRASLLLLLGMLPGTGFAAKGKAEQVYRVAIDKQFPPYEFVDQDGRVKGFTPELLRELGKTAGVSFELLPMDWPEAVTQLKNGRIDLINMIRTSQRAELYEFSQPHSYIKQAIFRHVSAEDITDLQSLAGHRVALQNNDISLEMLADRNDFSRQVIQDKSQGFLLLNAGKVEAFLAAEQTGLRLIHEYTLDNVEPARVGLFPQDFCFSARKGNSALIDILDRGLVQLKESGRYDAIVKQWLTLSIPEQDGLTKHRSQVILAIAALTIILTGFIVWNLMLRRAVELRTRALSKSRDSLKEAQQIARLGSWEWDLNSDSVHCSSEIYRIFEVKRQNLFTDFNAFINALHPDDRQQIRISVEKAISDKLAKWTLNYRILLPTGELRFLHEEAQALFGVDGRIEKRVGTVQDVTRQKLLEDSLLRMNRKLKAISACNQILMRVSDEQALLNAACHIISEQAGYRLAWVGYAEEDLNKSIRPLAWSGDSEYVMTAELSWSAETEAGRGAAGVAIRTGETVTVQDFSQEQKEKPWRKSAFAHGYRSAMALPLKDENARPFAVLLLYAEEPQIATLEEIELMEKLAGDLAFGVIVLRYRAEREKAEKALRISEERYRMVFENSPVPIWEEDFSAIGEYFEELRQKGVSDLRSYLTLHPQAVRQCAERLRIIDVNRATLQLHEANSKAELLAGLTAIFTSESFETFREELIELWNGETEMVSDSIVKTLTGELRHVRVYFSLCPGHEKTLSRVIVSIADVTQHKQIEEEIRTLNTDLEQRVKIRTYELEEKNAELERLNKLFVGRELRMMELKEQIKELSA